MAVYANWAAFGFVGLGFLMEGFARDAYFPGLCGVAAIVSGLVGHLVINRVFAQGFTSGEVALGLAGFLMALLIIVVAWVGQQLSRQGVYISLTLVSTLLAGVFVYLATRFGMRGAFSRFHTKRQNGAGR